MKKNFLSLLILFLSITSCQSQPEIKTLVNDPNAEKRNVAAFNGIKVSNSITLYLSQGNEDGVAVSCSDANDNKKIITEVKNGVLSVSMENGFWGSFNWKDKKVKAYVSVKNIDFISVSGASSVRINESIISKNLKISISGASNIKGNITVADLKVNLSGASSVNLTGKSATAEIDASGASNFKSYDFEVANCNIDASGASSVNIAVTNELKAEASGASSIKYKGNPTNSNINATGASSIKKKTD